MEFEIFLSEKEIPTLLRERNSLFCLVGSFVQVNTGATARNARQADFIQYGGLSVSGAITVRVGCGR